MQFWTQTKPLASSHQTHRKKTTIYLMYTYTLPLMEVYVYNIQIHFDFWSIIEKPLSTVQSGGHGKPGGRMTGTRSFRGQ